MSIKPFLSYLLLELEPVERPFVGSGGGGGGDMIGFSKLAHCFYEVVTENELARNFFLKTTSRTAHFAFLN